MFLYKTIDYFKVVLTHGPYTNRRNIQSGCEWMVRFALQLYVYIIYSNIQSNESSSAVYIVLP